MAPLFQTEFSTLRQKTGLDFEALEKSLGFSRRTLTRYESGVIEPKQVVLDALRRLVQDAGTVSTASGRFKFIDLFAGIGGMRRGFEAIGGKCVLTSEWNTFAQQTYLANFHDGDDHILAGDITGIPAAEIPAHDVLLAGFPCQPFSIAGVSKKNSLGREHGFKCEAQGTLFFDVARIIEHHQPAAFLLENVKNLLNHDKGNTFRVICKTLRDELGYHLHWQVLDAKSFVPQHRERIFIVGFKEENDFSFDDLELPDPLVRPKLGTILHPEDGSERPENHYTEGDLASVCARYTLTDRLWQYLQNYADKHRAQGNGFGFGLVNRESVTRTLSARYYKDGSEILIQQEGKNPRRLTPRECARLLGFDRPDAKKFIIPVSDMQAYKQFGNAVVPPLVEAVAKCMSRFISGVKVAQVRNASA